MVPHLVKKQVRDLGIGSFGTAVLVRDRRSGELVAVKYILLCDVSRSCCCAAFL